ncbi:hypothetical protein BSK65_06325 [Paenibacillus odorifer]|uniref:Uncharacterized protein n=1 Tax=Paenibacillus odorifer TaxID=189426 RepID=A0A1R0ZMQ9_9BACL|nr:hypothetical protein BSK65_06325 [Paenibacillus odorifer]
MLAVSSAIQVGGSRFTPNLLTKIGMICSCRIHAIDLYKEQEKGKEKFSMLWTELNRAVKTN